MSNRKVPDDVRANWTPLQIDDKEEYLCVKLPADGGKPGGTILIDSGSPDGVSLAEKYWAAWKAANPHQPVTMAANYIAGVGLFVTEQSWAYELSLNGVEFHNVPVQLSAAVSPAHRDPAYEGMIGLAALHSLNLVIDGKSNTAYVQTTDAPAVPYVHNRLGAVFVPRDEDNDDLVAHVAPNSPAARSRNPRR